MLSNSVTHGFPQPLSTAAGDLTANLFQMLAAGLGLAALFPQFISAEASFWPQFIALSLIYLVLDGLFLSFYGVSSGWIASRLKEMRRKWIDCTGGSFMIVAAVLLGLKTLKQS